MLKIIGNYIGGNVRIVKNNKSVIWVCDDRKKIYNIINILYNKVNI